MLAFDFEPGVKAWRRACAAQGWYWTAQDCPTAIPLIECGLAAGSKAG